MPDRELDAWIAEKVMGWRFPNYDIFPHYTTDRNAAALVLEKIGELGLIAEFIGALYFHGALRDWDMLTASPRVWMEAVKKCMEERTVPE